ncbi:Glutathione S-transferase, N-terminal [Penicillium italicum]|uniref:Glutathione S-transferase, N-terminal n=1 Tax=Penicillium italicum TaxID=40296 RepID=A0A0A2LE00_PENIT|nr:Glutathione S-transferase, N-terminal [Penicillium italicum]
MSPTIKPIQLYGNIIGPNPQKVAIVLTILELPFEIVPVPYDKVKEPEYEAINPNGRLPSIHDPNTDLTIWESGAIIEYLIERYDTKEPRKLSFAPLSAEAELARSFLHLQMSGQGPYYGQAYWFKSLHAEKVPSAVKRYVNEAKRVTGVLDKWLAKQKEAHAKDIGDGPWLVGNKLSYADVAFIPWQRTARGVYADDGFDVDEFPNEKEWFERMTSKKPIKAVLDSADEQRANLSK